MAEENLKNEEIATEGETKPEGEGGEAGAEGKVVAGGASKKTLVKKIVLFGVVPVVVIILGITGAYFMGFLDGLFPHEAEAPAQLNCEKIKEGDEHFEECKIMAEEANSAMPGAFVDIPDMIVNLKSDSDRPRFLKIVLDVEVMNEVEKAKFTPLMPRVIDQFQMYLRELRFEDLKGTAGIYRMKLELLNRIRSVAPDVKVKDILFQEILVQ